MHILCTICSDLLNQAENIFVTKCGHVFHYVCLVQWIDRSKSCPQCRNKVTEKCMFRLYPTISNESSGDDVATLQSRLDDALLQLRQKGTSCKEHIDKLAQVEAAFTKQSAVLKAHEKKLESRETAISAIQEQMVYLKEQNKETQKLKEENTSLKKNMQTMNGLQKVLNATSEDVERMVVDYSDVRTLATFTTALKRALCESESKKKELRDRLQVTKQKLTSLKNTSTVLHEQLALSEDKLALTLRKYKSVLKKLGSSDADLSKDDSFNADRSNDGSSNDDSSIANCSNAKRSHADSSDIWPSAPKKMRSDLNQAFLPDSRDNSFNTVLTKIKETDSPYLRLQRSSVALSLANRAPAPDRPLKPSEYALINSAREATKMPSASIKNSILQASVKVKFFQENVPTPTGMDISYDGLGGHSKVDYFPVPTAVDTAKSRIPKLTAKHKLKRPSAKPIKPSQDIGKMLKKQRDKS